MFEDIDKKYYYDGDDLGAVYSPENTVFKVWAPTADKARIQLYKSCTDEKPFRKLPMTKDKDNKGIWSKLANGNLDGVYYTYVFTTDDLETETIDVYAKSAGANGAMGFIFDPASTNPPDWEEDRYVDLPHYTDACIYELHVRDFSIDSSGRFCYRGRFLAFIEKHLRNNYGHRIGLSHLKELGITHVQLQPIFDFQTVDETNLKKPQFNWGYDPQNFNCPEGSYSTNPYDGRARVSELKKLVRALHKNGIGVIMDVVYNHTYATADSAFTKTFDKYYYRNWDNHYANGSGCGNEVATERAMVRKYIIDSLCYFAKEYKIDGFRFDLMGLYDSETLNIAEKKLREINPSVILYGEGWTGGDSPLDYARRAMKLNARAVPAYGFFSDDFRDTIKGNNFINKDRGYVNGVERTEHFVREVISGRIPHPQLPGMTQYSWTDHPTQTVNYVEAHDNLTLWDKLFYSNSGDTEATRIKMDKLAAAFVFLSQGIPFFQAGQEFLRSKPLPGGNSFDHNSYNSPDIINSLKWDRKSKYIEVFNYYKGLIEFRKNHTAVRMYDGEQVAKNLKYFDNLPPRIIGFGLYGDNELDEILVFYNAGEYPVQLFAFEELDVYIDGESAGNVPLRKVSGEYELAGISVMVLGKKREKRETQNE
jgi:pullulanase